MNKTSLYKSVKEWLESKGYKVLITAEKQEVVVPIKYLFPVKNYIIPDVISIKEHSIAPVVVVEVGTRIEQIYELIVKCLLWKTRATLVYLAYPKEICKEFKILEKYGIGLLSIDNGEVQEVIKMMPKEPLQLYKVTELHPLDHAREQEFLKQIKDLIPHQ